MKICQLSYDLAINNNLGYPTKSEHKHYDPGHCLSPGSRSVPTPPIWPGHAVWPDHAVSWILTYPIKETQYLTYSMLKLIINVYKSTHFQKLWLILVQTNQNVANEITGNELRPGFGSN